MSFPLRGRGLKSSGPIRSIKGILSFPLRERGLKSAPGSRTARQDRRSPHGNANWIITIVDIGAPVQG